MNQARWPKYGPFSMLVKYARHGFYQVLLTLARGLEVQPRLREELVGRGRVGEGLRGVVGGEQVFDDGAGFPEGEGGVWVCDGGDAAVGVEGFEGLCFVDCLASGREWFVVGGWDDGNLF